jgi:predicted outer membrane repeat protein
MFSRLSVCASRPGIRGSAVAVVLAGAMTLTSCIQIAEPGVALECLRTSSATVSLAATVSWTPTVYSWSLGDGSTSTSRSVTHTYASRGTYTVNLNVSDANGRHAAASTTVTVGHDWRVPEDGAIQSVIDSATPGDTVLVSTGGGPVLVTKEIQLVASTRCTLSLVLYRGTPGVLRGFSLEGDPEGEVSALTLSDAAPMVEDCVFADAHAIQGGAVFALNSPARFQGCEFVGNSSELGGGAVYATGDRAFPSFRECVFENNHAGDAGGAVCLALGSTPLLPQAICSHIEGCAFLGNSGQQSPGSPMGAVGGAIHVGVGCCAVLGNNTFSANTPSNVVWENPLP